MSPSSDDEELGGDLPPRLPDGDLEKLTEIQHTLNEFAEAYVLNDIEVTKKGMNVAKQDEDAAQPFYV